MSIDLRADARVLACADVARATLRGPTDELLAWRRAALASVVRWEYAQGDRHPIEHPLGIDVNGFSRGHALDAPEEGGRRFGFDAAERLVVNGMYSARVNRVAYLHRELASDDFRAVIFEESPDETRKQLVSAWCCTWLAPQREMLVVGCSRSGESRSHTEFESPRDVVVRSTSRDFSRTHEYRAKLDAEQQPIEIEHDGRIVFRRAAAPVGPLVKRARELLEQSAVAEIEAAATRASIAAVCLGYGGGPELFPPWLVIFSEERVRARMPKLGPLVWEPASHDDAGEVIYFDGERHAELLQVTNAILERGLDDKLATQVAGVTAEVAKRLRKHTWSPAMHNAKSIVFFAADIEDGAWRNAFRAALGAKQRQRFDADGLLPPAEP